jgi:hypothetical protein
LLKADPGFRFDGASGGCHAAERTSPDQDRRLGSEAALFFLTNLIASLHGRGDPANRYLIVFLLTYAVSFPGYPTEDTGLYRLESHELLLTDPLGIFLGTLTSTSVVEMVSGSAASKPYGAGVAHTPLPASEP